MSKAVQSHLFFKPTDGPGESLLWFDQAFRDMISKPYRGVGLDWTRDSIPSESDGELGGGLALTLHKLATPRCALPNVLLDVPCAVHDSELISR